MRPSQCTWVVPLMGQSTSKCKKRPLVNKRRAMIKLLTTMRKRITQKTKIKQATLNRMQLRMTLPQIVQLHLAQLTWRTQEGDPYKQDREVLDNQRNRQRATTLLDRLSVMALLLFRRTMEGSDWRLMRISMIIMAESHSLSFCKASLNIMC